MKVKFDYFDLASLRLLRGFQRLKARVPVTPTETEAQSEVATPTEDALLVPLEGVASTRSASTHRCLPARA